MLERLTLQDFETSVGASYGLAVGAQSVAMTLCDARAIGSAPLGDATRTPFSLEFEAPLRLGQQTYPVTFPDGTCTEIFLVPIKATDTGGTRLQAIFT